jgi:hypothetical protein
MAEQKLLNNRYNIQEKCFRKCFLIQPEAQNQVLDVYKDGKECKIHLALL